MIKSRILQSTAMVLLLLAGSTALRAEALLPRFPNAHGNKIVFVAGGNLWQVDKNGGTAARLTSDSGQDMMPRYSPDGKWIAFTANYQGNEDVYVMPAAGGDARRLTFQSDIFSKTGGRHGANNLVLAWTPDSQKIVFLSRRLAWNVWINRLFAVPVMGGMPQTLPLDSGGLLSYGPDGHSIAYNRIFRNFRTWKRYTGGLAQQIFTYDFDSKKLTQITDWKGTNTAPMWVGAKIYFLSDNDKNFRQNIFVTDLVTKETRQVTHFDDYDIDFPSLGDNEITFQQGGALYALDLPDEKLRKLEVTIPDDGRRTMARMTDAAPLIRDSDMAQQIDYALSPNGKRALFSARGEIFSLPADQGAVRNLTHSDRVDEDHPAWSPDGKFVAYTSDRSGTMQVALRPAMGGDEKQLTSFDSGYFYQPVFAPDGKHIAFSDNEHRVWVVSADGGTKLLAGQDKIAEIHDYSFSPDGKFLAFGLHRDAQQRDIAIFEIVTGNIIIAADQLNDNFNPIFSPDGKYLYFLSARHENPTQSENEFNVANIKSTGIYAVTLRQGTASPFAPKSDEATLDDTSKAADGKDKSTKPVKIDFDGLMHRAVLVPVDIANITSLDLRDDKIFYMTQAPQLLEGALPGEKSALHLYDVGKRKDGVVADGLGGYTLSADGTRVLIKEGPGYAVIDAAADGGKSADTKKTIKTDGMMVRIEPRHEWQEVFDNAWRLERDFFYSPVMNGMNWRQVHDAYAKLLPLAGSREDVNYLIGQMLGEMGNSHTYVGEGDDGDLTPEVRTGLLGADFALDAASGRYKFQKIYGGDNTRAAYRSPLTEPGLDIHQGDYLLAINGNELRAPDSPDSAMVGLSAGAQVTLSIAKTADAARRDVVVMPVKSELSLREKDWIDHNRQIVDTLSGGKIGYIYLSDMEQLGMQQFFRQFYGQLGKQALIIDDRWNGGGFIDQIVLERLRRVLVGMSTDREAAATTIPQQVLAGPMACLINHYSASDGDIFPFYFRKYGLGPLIGTRTWGGVRGIRGEWKLRDGGMITIPEGSLYGLDSAWVMENHGVDPDITLENEPGDLMAGHDRQLEKAVAVLMEKRGKAWPPPPALLPAYPKEGIVPGPHF
jgi:tricorn protease